MTGLISKTVWICSDAATYNNRCMAKAREEPNTSGDADNDETMETGAVALRVTMVMYIMPTIMTMRPCAVT